MLSSLQCSLRNIGAGDFNLRGGLWCRRGHHGGARNDLGRAWRVASGHRAGRRAEPLIVVLGLGLEQRKIEIEDNHILALAAGEQPYKLQKFGDKTFLGHQNLHA